MSSLPNHDLGALSPNKHTSNSNCLGVRGEVKIGGWIYHLVSSPEKVIFVWSIESSDNIFRLTFDARG